MIGRYRDPQGINYPFKTIKQDPIEINFDKLLDKGENIYILAHQPGIGKTYSVMEYLKQKIKEDDNFKFFFFTDRHEAIKERIKNWDEGSYSHWIGFEKICKNNNYKMLYEKYNLSPFDICKECKKCNTYLNQFQNNKRVFAPFNYLISPQFKKIIPDIIFLDESIKQYNSYSTNFEKAEQVFNAIRMRGVAKNVNNSKDMSFSGFSDMIIDAYKGYLIDALKSNNKNLLNILEGFNIYDFFQYAKWNNIYGYNIKEYGVPSYYYGAFNGVVKGIPTVFMDATFNQYIFSYILESFNGEMRKFNRKGFSNLNIQIFKKLHQNKNTIIYRMHPEDSMPKSNFTNPKNWEHTKDWLTRDIKIIMEIYGRNNVGIITFSDFGNTLKSFGFDVEYYGNLRGTNVLEDKEVLVLIGSYLPIVASWKDTGGKKEEKDYFEEILSKYFLLNVNEKNLISIGIEAPKLVSNIYNYRLARVYGYKYIDKFGKLFDTPADITVNYPAEALNVLFWYDEIYQAFHRNRGLRKENKRTIFSYCWFPEPGATIYSIDKQGHITNKEIGKLQLFTHDLRNEFNIDKIDNDIVNHLFDLLKDSEKDGLIEKITTYILQHPEANATEISNIFRIYKKGKKRGLDTEPITWLIKSFQKIREEGKRLE